jgi:hypothetical protein
MAIAIRKICTVLQVAKPEKNRNAEKAENLKKN